MTQLFRIFISGEDVTNRTSGCNITYQINRMYNIAIFDFDELPISEETVSIDFGDRHFEGFIYKSSRKSKGIYSVECRTKGAKLTEPYYSSGDYVVEDATTSHELCALYGVINTCEDLNFGGNYERRGTPLSALTTVANVLGAEFWDDESGIRIEPNKPISGNGTIIKDSDIFDFVPMRNDIHQRGIKTIMVGSQSNPNEITTQTKCNAKIDECSGEVISYVVPHDSFIESDNIELSEVRIAMQKIETIAEGYSFTLDADIVSIESVKINGVFVSDYTFKYDTIVFDSPKRGIIAVEYHGYALKGYASIRNIEGQDYTEFNIYYGSCNIFSFQQILNCNGSTDTLAECGGVWVNMPKIANYAVGFSLKTFGGTPYFTFYTDTNIIGVNVQTTDTILQQVEAAILSEEDNGDIRHKTRFRSVSLTEVRSNGTDITSHATLVGEYIEFDDDYPGVVISYQVSAQEHYVKFADQIGSVTMGVNGGDGQCEYPLDGNDYDSTSSSICAEGASVAIDMISELGVKSWEATYKNIYVTDPNNVEISLQCDGFGVLHIEDIIFGIYTLDTSNIQPGSKLTLNAGGSN